VINNEYYINFYKNSNKNSSNSYLLLYYFSNFFNTKKNSYNDLLSNVNIFYLKHERTYTKLKYSRVPQADIVSGGLAALFAGFIGYLISEKFGFELIDSGEFYFLVMYLVFFIASLKF
jgi:hypothetical protein